MPRWRCRCWKRMKEQAVIMWCHLLGSEKWSCLSTRLLAGLYSLRLGIAIHFNSFICLKSITNGLSDATLVAGTTANKTLWLAVVQKNGFNQRNIYIYVCIYIRLKHLLSRTTIVTIGALTIALCVQVSFLKPFLKLPFSTKQSLQKIDCRLNKSKFVRCKLNRKNEKKRKENPGHLRPEKQRKDPVFIVPRRAFPLTWSKQFLHLSTLEYFSFLCLPVIRFQLEESFLTIF